MTLLAAEARRLCQQLPFIRQPGVHPDRQLSFIGPVPNLNPWALNLFLAVSQGQVFAGYPLLKIQGNSPTPPPLPIPSKKRSALNRNTC